MNSLNNSNFLPIIKPMDSIIPIIIIGAPLLGCIGIGIIVMNLLKRGVLRQKKTVKTQDVILKEVNKRLAQNPQDPEALSSLADIYF